MPQFLRRHPLLIVSVVSILLVLLMIITTTKQDIMAPVEGVVGEVVTPVQKVMYKITTSVYNFFAGIQERRDMEEDYKSLKEKYAHLEGSLTRMTELEKENERLKRLLEFKKDREELIQTGARVIGKNPGNWFNIFLIDKGENEGIVKNMAVVNDLGLIGRVTEVGPNWSKVRAIIDGQSSVSGIIERTRDDGQVKGNNSLTMEDGTCRMIYLSLDSDIIPGDRVITSGYGEIFPKGIFIGEVKEVYRNKRDLYKTAIVQPAVDFQRLEEVLVIRTSVGTTDIK